ncbi:MAG TPA: hypothetical protein VFH36_09440 [Acidimicrobiales bacterium]|nr:hypothetical protein [Acidimicrobiales bacterium]
MAQYAVRHRDEDPVADEGAAPLPGDADGVELPGGHEAERLTGQLGDGPVVGPGHGGRGYGGGMTPDRA